MDNISNWIEDQTTVINWEELIEDFKKNPNKYKHPEQKETNKNIGIGTDGKTVNMDLWHYYIESGIESGNEIVLSSQASSASYYPGYDNANITEEGTIMGKMPQFIYDAKTDKTYPVTILRGTFHGCTKLITAPEIPLTVTDMQATFDACTGLTTVPEIPSSVTKMICTFRGCTNLINIPEIPSSVTDMIGTFAECTNLTTAPTIPSSVKDMRETFYGCTKLMTAPEIPSSVTNMEWTFRGCTGLLTAPMIPSSVTNMNATFQGCTKLMTAPTIPSGVTSLDMTFTNCINLTGNLIINANPTGYNKCLTDAATADDANLIVSGSSTVLDKIIATKSDNSHITKGN